MNRIYCDKTSGTCAEGCIPGWYNDKCNLRCSKTCSNKTCNHQTGECILGCIDGRKGRFCETEALNVKGNPVCPPGTYGDTCHKNCSERCRAYSVTNRIYCDKNSGTCAEGCIPGWYNDKCNMRCSKTCSNKACNHQTGECILGCIDGRKGRFCETEVTNGRHAGKAQQNSEQLARIVSVIVVYDEQTKPSCRWSSRSTDGR
ncbi:scavenger receptor class F member 1-like [Haliotis asinina]|uniref:scavenger receptor class F member 1-like n=1 Tax=Haliotis asinina TaxID=109174 RepID=UPI003531EA5F